MLRGLGVGESVKAAGNVLDGSGRHQASQVVVADPQRFELARAEERSEAGTAQAVLS